MNHASPTPPTTSAIPTSMDYMLILIGIALSLLFAEMISFQASRTADSPSWMTSPLARIVPSLLFLPVGVVLWWPIFALIERLRGRTQDLTWAEKLWGLIWLVDLLVVGLILWAYFRRVPDDLMGISIADMKRYLGTGMYWLVLVVAAYAFVLTILSSRIKRQRAWTHHFGLALLLWPIIPMLLVWFGKLRLDFLVQGGI